MADVDFPGIDDGIIKLARKIHRQYLFGRSHVHAIDDGRTDKFPGVVDGTRCINLYVSQLDPQGDQPPFLRVYFDGDDYRDIPLQYIPRMQAVLQMATEGDFQRPTVNGISIGLSGKKDTSGTLGTIVRDNETCDLRILSCNHVLANYNKATKGDNVMQPALVGLGDLSEGTVKDYTLGELDRSSRLVEGEGKTNWTDSAIAKPISAKDVLNDYKCNVDAGKVIISERDFAIGVLIGGQTKVIDGESIPYSICSPIQSVEAELGVEVQHPTKVVEKGMKVCLCGSTSGYVTGEVINEDYDFTPSYYPYTFTSQILTTKISDAGDSGSLVFACP